MERRFSILPWAAAALIVVGLAAGAVVLGVLVSAHRAADTLALNCGGPALSKGRAVADNRTYNSHTAPAPRSLVRGDPVTSQFHTVAIANPGIDLVYTFSVNPNSKVEITAKFAELVRSARSGSRMLRLSFNGQIIRDNLDVFDTVGAAEKGYEASKTIFSKSGAVEIRVQPLTGSAMIAGIDVLARGGVRAGGPLAVNATKGNVNLTDLFLAPQPTPVVTNTSPTPIAIVTTPTPLPSPSLSSTPAPSATTTPVSNSDNSTPTNSTTPADTTTPDEPKQEPTTPASAPARTPAPAPEQPASEPAPQPAPSPAPATPRMVGSGTWRTVTLRSSVLPAARHEACSVMTEGKVYLIGGRGSRPVNVYDPKTQTWATKSTPPEEMNHMQCVSVGSKIYVVGAWKGPFPNEKNHDSTWVYDTTTDTWSKEPAPPVGRNRGGGGAVYHNGAIYLVMGNIGGHGDHAESLGFLDKYDLATKTWTALATAPDPRDHVGAAVVNGRLCVAGGRDGGVKNFWGTPITPVNCYDFASDKWTRGPNMPEGRAGAATGATCNGLLMVAGGEGRPAGTTEGGDAFARVDLYDPVNNKWLPPSNLKRKRHGSGLAVAECTKCANIYLPSGSGNQAGSPELTSMEVWSPDGVARDC